MERVRELRVEVLRRSIQLVTIVLSSDRLGLGLGLGFSLSIVP
jgi:hypothetical protein